MTGFPDIEAFARRHAACGGITPNASVPVGGGYLLTLTCVCGATRDRWITPEEARLPLAAPPPAPPAEPVAPPVPPPRPPGPTPSPELQEVLREALEAEGVSEAEAEQAPEPSPDLQEALRLALEAESEPDAAPEAPPRSPELQDVLRAALETEAAAPPPAKKEVVPSVDLQAALRRAVQADVSAGARPTKPAMSTPSRRAPEPPPKGGRLDDALKQALRAQPATVPAALVTRPPATRFWFGLVAALGLLVVVGGWYLLTDPGALVPSPAAAPQTVAAGSTPAAESPAPLTDEARTAIAGILQSLHQVQAASTPTTPFATYSSRVLFARADLDRFLQSSTPPAVKAAVRDTLEVYALAFDAWRARSSRQAELFELIGQNPLIDACPSVKRLADFAEQTGSQTRAHARGVAVSNAVPTVWECAADKLAALEKAASAR